MKRNFTMQRSCKFCRIHFTIASSNHWFCGFSDCTRRRRKADRDARKPALPAGSDGHLERALKGD
jgi:hypothetical protein